MVKCYEMIGIMRTWAEDEKEARKKLWRDRRPAEMAFETLREVQEGSGPETTEEMLGETLKLLTSRKQRVGV